MSSASMPPIAKKKSAVQQVEDADALVVDRGDPAERPRRARASARRRPRGSGVGGAHRSVSR